MMIMGNSVIKLIASHNSDFVYTVIKKKKIGKERREMMEIWKVYQQNEV